MVDEPSRERARAFLEELDHQGKRRRPPEDHDSTRCSNDRPSVEERLNRDSETLRRDWSKMHMTQDRAEHPLYVWHEVHSVDSQVTGRSLISTGG